MPMQTLAQLLPAAAASITRTDTPHPLTTVPLHPLAAAYPWHYEARHPAQAAVLPAIRQFLSAILTGARIPCWLSLLGPSGIGKTYVLRQAMDCLQRARVTGAWKIPTATGRRGPQIAHLIPAEDLQDWRAPRDFAKYDVIYLEDIGSGSDLDAGAGKVLRSRIAELLQLRSGRWTLLCANLTRAEISAQLDPRIASRLKRDESICLELPQDGPDYWE